MSLTREQEEDYERRRQEELRRQILLKEKELEKLTSNKDRLRLRIEKQMVGGTQPTRLPPQSLQSPYS